MKQRRRKKVPLQRNPIVRALIMQPNRNAGKHKPNNVRTKQVNTMEE